MLGKRLGKSFVSAVGAGSVLLATAAAYARLTPFLAGNHSAVRETVSHWIAAGTFSADFAFRLDVLSAVMVSFVTFVGFLIHLYSIGYMRGEATEAGYARYFAYLNLFLFSMLVLVLADNFLLLFLGWEGVGLCSYLLIGYDYERPSAAAAGKKAFVVNRIGDFGFLLGLFGLFALFGSLDFDRVFSQAAADPARFAPYLTVVCLCLFVGAMGKSAQGPLFVWLPDAMAGPTPVSALIHAATMVTAGVYMVARCNVLFGLAPEAMRVVAWVGGATAIFAAVIAVAQNDIKKVLAYSTVSQLGYMFLACGVGAYVAGMFHVVTHAFFKACLFLGSGAVIHAMGGEQDIRRMGGLRRKLPATYATFLIATLALAGVPPLAGFFSKDAILAGVFEDRRYVLFGIGLVTAGLTAFYMLRLVSLTFGGSFRGTPEQERHVHEAPATMRIPLLVLARALDSRRLDRPSPGLRRARTGSRRSSRPSSPSRDAGRRKALRHRWRLLMGLSVAAAAAGLLLAWSWYQKGRGRTPASIAAAAPSAYALVRDKFRVDELYDAVIVRPFILLARALWKVIDVLVIDGVLNAGAFSVELAGDLLRFLQTGNVRNYALTFFLGVIALLLIVIGVH